VPDYTFFMNPMSRAQIARWALHEAGANYKDTLVEWGDKPPALLDANPMGKLPTIIHHADGGDRVVTEAAAICAYLAEMHPEAGLLPNDAQMADYYRWMFFAADHGQGAGL
jgi:glutathione S-transferase